MKIVMVSSSVFPFHNSGVAYVVHNTAKELTAMGHQVTVIGLCEKNTDLTYSDYKVIGLPIPGVSHNFNGTLSEKDYNNETGAKIIENTLHQIKPDLVHFHALNGIGANIVKNSKILGYKTAVTMHDWWWICPFSNLADKNHKPCNQLKLSKDKCTKCISQSKHNYIETRSDFLKNILKDYTDLIIPVSSYVESYLEPIGITANKVITIPNGAEPYTNQGTRPSAPKNPIILGFLGGKHELKGHDILIEACQKLSSTSSLRGTAYEIHIYGTLQLGAGIVKKVITYIKDGNIKGLIDKIRRHMPNNKQNQKLPIIYHPLFKPEEKDLVYENIDILLSLSKVKESSSLVVREALIRGIPVITTPSGGPEEVILHGKNGIILKESSAEELKLAIHQILTTNIHKNMTEYIRQNPYNYTTRDQAKETIAAYERCFEDESRKNT